MIVTLTSLSETVDLARRLAPILKSGDMIALHGGLGVGKTTFSRALISDLMGHETEVPSPTYTLVQIYEAPSFPIFHFDLYRLDDPEEVFELGWETTTEGLALVEWPWRAGQNLPDWRLDVTLTLNSSAETRTARLEPRGEDWQRRLHEL